MKDALLNHLSAQGGVRRVLIHIHDLAVTTIAFPVSMLLRENFELTNQHLAPLLYGSLLILITAIFVFRLTGLQRSMWRYTSPYDLLSIVKAVSLVLTIFVSVMFVFDRLISIPRSIVFIYWLVAFVGLAGPRIIYGCCMVSRPMQNGRLIDHTPTRALIVGKLPAAVALIQRVQALHADRLKIIGVLSDTAEAGRSVHGTAILGSTANFQQIAALLDVQGLYPQLIIAADLSSTGAALQQLANSHNIRLTAAANLDDLDVANHWEAEHKSLFQALPKATIYHRVKRIIEGTFALSGLIAVAPLLLVICFFSLITLGAPVLFDQYRAGQRMREFTLLKFRTMRNAFDASGRILSDAERTSFFGSLLRYTRLDELPQLWNVVSGDMALIGPRPLLRRDLPRDQATLKERYSVRPGLTGWAQVNGGQQLSLGQKMALDLYYIRNASFLFDMKILALTIRMVFFGERVNTHAIEHAQLAIAPP